MGSISSLVKRILLLCSVMLLMCSCGTIPQMEEPLEINDETTDEPDVLEEEEFIPLHTYEITYPLEAVSGYIAANSSGDYTRINPMHIDGCEYLFLPAAVNNESLCIIYNTSLGKLYLSTSEGPCLIESSIPINISPYMSDDLGNGAHIVNILFEDIYGESVEKQIYVLNGSQIASVYITSDDPVNEGRTFLDSGKFNETTATINVLGADGKTIYSGHLKNIRARGNNTFMADKKPYQITLSEKFDLLETQNPANKNKKWLLLANARDATFVRNSVSLDLADRIGLNTVEFRPVDFYYDGEYHGCHLLCEKVERADGRLSLYDIDKANELANKDVDLSELETVEGTNKYNNPIQYVEGANTPSDYRRGYLIESDVGYYREENGWFALSTGSQFGIKYPKYPTKEEVEYISEYMEEAYQAAVAGGVNPDTGKSVWVYLDKDSFVKNYVLNEVVGNRDYFSSSGFLYMNSNNGPLISGPAWDFDATFGVGEIPMEPDELRVSDDWIEWGVAVCSLPDFRSAVHEYYYNTGYALALDDHISQYVEEIRASMKMDRIFCNKSLQAWDKRETYDQDVEYLTNYANDRREWFKNIVSNW